MTRPRRLLLVSLLAAWVGMVLACGGGGSREQVRGGADEPARITTHERGEQKRADEQGGPAERKQADERERLEARKAFEAAIKEYEARLAAHKAEVERVNAENVRRQAQHEKVLDKWREDFKAFQKAEGEYKAAPELRQALDLYSDSRTKLLKGETRESERLMDTVWRRCKKIMESYPGTQAARDAEKLSRGQPVDARPLPSRPVPPDRPSGPDLLPTPSPPVAPVYTDPVQAREKNKDLWTRDHKPEWAKKLSEAVQKAWDDTLNDDEAMYTGIFCDGKQTKIYVNRAEWRKLTAFQARNNIMLAISLPHTDQTVIEYVDDNSGEKLTTCTPETKGYQLKVVHP